MATPPVVPGETTIHLPATTGSVLLNVLQGPAIDDYFDGTADEEIRIMVTTPGDTDGPSVFLSIYPDGTWTVTTVGIPGRHVDVE